MKRWSRGMDSMNSFFCFTDDPNTYLQDKIADASRRLQNALHIDGFSVIIFNKISFLCHRTLLPRLLGCAAFSFCSSSGSRMLWSWVSATAFTELSIRDDRPSTARQSPARSEARREQTIRDQAVTAVDEGRDQTGSCGEYRRVGFPDGHDHYRWMETRKTTLVDKIVQTMIQRNRLLRHILSDLVVSDRV